MLSLTVPAMNSRPGAAQTLYLDFDGSAPFAWSNSTGNFTVRGPNSTAEFPASVPAFSTDGDFNNFSAAELATIDHIWQWVAEKFSPFTINVTTVNPGFVFDSLTMTCLVAGSVGDWYGGTAGGTSSIGGFVDGGPNTCFVFSADAVNNGLPGGRLEQYLGESIAHEAGHEVGLVHERSPGDEYYDGDIFRAPIMGGSSNNTQGRGIWWRTNNFTGQNSSDSIQDELNALTQDAPFRLQFAGDTGGGSLSFDGAGKVITSRGIINSTSDVDSFTFTATGAHATFTIKNWQYGGMLAPTVKIRISSTQTYVSATIVTANTSAAIDTSNLTVGGNYVLEIGSQGNYGDIGQYTVDGSQTVFAAYDAASRSVTVGGFAGNNNVTLSASGGTLTVQDSINGGPISTQTFTLSLVDSVHVNLGSGDDKLNCVGLSNANNSALPVYILMGGGFDTLNLGGGSTFLTFTVNAIVIDVSFAGVRSAQFWNFDAERVEIHGTTSDSDLFNINSLNNYSNVYAYGDQGNDKLVVSPEVMASNTYTAIFYGGAGTDTLELNGSTLGIDQKFTLLGNTVQRFLPSSPFASEIQFDSTLETISIKGGGGNDDFLLLGLAAGQTLTATGNGGDDAFHVGKSNNGPFPFPYSANIFGTINVLGGNGNDVLNVDDVAYTSILNGFSITNNSFFNQNTSGKITFDSTLDQFAFQASNAGSRFVTVFGLPAVTSLNLMGGTGVGDTLIFDDRTLAIAPVRVDVGPVYYKEYYSTPQAPTIRELAASSGFENFRVTTHNSTNVINVYGTGISPVGQSLQINAGVNADTITLFPHDLAGHMTIGGSVSIFGGGGSDNLIIDDTGQANPINYVFTNTFAGFIDRIDGLGTGVVSPSSDIENITIKGGDGNDTVAFNGHKLNSAVAIYGGEGNDTVDFGGGDLSANIANLPSFLFDGQGGFDTFNLHNDASTSPWNYTRTTDFLRADRQAGAAYALVLNQLSVEFLLATGGTQPDQFFVQTISSGSTSQFDGAGGDDSYLLGNAMSTAGILGAVYLYDSDGTDSVSIDDRADVTGKTLHIDQYFVGGAAGDNLFGPGGYLYYVGIAGAMTIKLGSGADTVYAAPNPLTPLFIEGNGPVAVGSAGVSGAGGGADDFLGLAFASVANPVFLPGSPGEGAYGFDNAAFFYYSGMESTAIDDVAPYVVVQRYDDSAVPTIYVEFSEDVSNSLTVYELNLIITTTSEQIPFANVQLAYDTATNTASFTFPGYINGVLPAGNYTAVIHGSLPDLFGNQLGTEIPLSFTVATMPPALPGDYNQNGEVDAADYILWRTTLGTTGLPVYSGADGDGNGDITPADYDVWRSHFGETLAPPGSNSAALATTQSVQWMATMLTAPAEPIGPAAITLAEPFDAAVHFDIAVPPYLPPNAIAVPRDTSGGKAPRLDNRDSLVVAASHDQALVAWLTASETGPQRDLLDARVIGLPNEPEGPDSSVQLESPLDMAFESLAV